MKKIAILGTGIGGCITALHYYYHGRDNIDKISLYHDPNVPIEPVGQGTTPDVTSLLFNTLHNQIYSPKLNILKATIKTGVSYEGWAKENIFHQLSSTNHACHYIPNLLSEKTINSGFFEVIEKSISDPESEIDADLIFDCRGKDNSNLDNYETLNNPINAVLLGKEDEVDPGLVWTRSVATPDGWTFIIPNQDSTSYGYLYNDTITNDEEAKNNFKKLFNITSSKKLNFTNHVTKKIYQGERTILNGTRFAFIEPLEATSASLYLAICKYAWRHIYQDNSKRILNENSRRLVKEIETFILWHYSNGSQYKTPFWDYAQDLWNNHRKFGRFDQMIDEIKDKDHINIMKCPNPYGAWGLYSFHQWKSAFN